MKRLAPGDEALLRATRLAALADAPAAFGTPFEVAADVGDAVDVIQVWVAPDHRGEGIVEELFAALEAWAPRARVDVAVAFGNDRARQICERLGCELVGERRSEHGTRDVELLLSRQLSSGGGR
jgi:GNAT superfamily N-acetyltransferase